MQRRGHDLVPGARRHRERLAADRARKQRAHRVVRAVRVVRAQGRQQNVLVVEERPAETKRDEGRGCDREHHRGQDERVANPMFGPRPDDHRRRVVLDRRRQATEHPGECRALGFEPDRRHRESKQDSAALTGADVREQGRKVRGHHPEDGTSDSVGGAEEAVEQPEGDDQRDRVDRGPDLRADAARQQGNRDRQHGDGWRADESVESARGGDDVQPPQVIGRLIVHVRRIGQVRVRALPHALRVVAARGDDCEHQDAQTEHAREQPVQDRSRHNVGRGAPQTLDQTAIQSVGARTPREPLRDSQVVPFRDSMKPATEAGSLRLRR